jgi:hypothetical protein
MEQSVDQNNAASLTDFIEGIREELQQAQRQSTGREPLFRIGPVELEFEIYATREKQGNAGLKFWVAQVGGDAKVAHSRTQRVKLTLSPMSSSGDPFDVHDELTQRPD